MSLIGRNLSRFLEWAMMRMRLGVIIFTLGAALVAGAITAPATNASSAPPARQAMELG